MKLSKLYSNDNRFREILFNEGFNVILGQLVEQKNLKTDPHNLGKSRLVELIDFMLLKKIDKDHFFNKHKSKFQDHVFYLEVKFDERRYLTIRRSVDKSSKVDLKFHDNPHQDFYMNEPFWDYEQLPLNATYIDRDPVQIINQYWGFQETLPDNYRSYISYFLRSQYDYDEIFKLKKHKGNDSTWKPPLANLLGFNGEVIKYKYKLESDITEEKKTLKRFETEFNISLKDLNRINAQLDVMEKRKLEVQDRYDSFDFYLKERELNKELIEQVETEISKLNTLEYKLEYELNEIRNSLSQKSTFDITAVENLFKEVKIYFPQELKKNYDDLIQFNRQITEERSRYLSSNAEKSSLELKKIRLQLKVLNDKRNTILSVISEKDSFAKFKHYQLELIEIENEISNLLSKLDNYEVLKTINERIQKLEDELQDSIEAIKLHLENGSALFKSIQSDFAALTEKIIYHTAILYHMVNASNNIHFDANIPGHEDELSAKADGFSYKKTLCVCFDLAVLQNYSDKNFFKFVYHDGSLESMADTKIETYLDTVRDVCNTYGIQYILTALEDHIPVPVEGTEKAITESEVVLTLDNRKDATGRLFGFDF